MTIPVPDQLEYTSDADGTTTEFPYPKRFLQPDEIVVLLRDAGGVDTQQYLNQHYSIAGSAWPNGGAISFYVAPAVGVKVVRYRMTQAKQTVDLENRQRNDAPSVELQLDRLTMAIQDRGRLGDAAWWGLLAETAARVNGDKLLNLRVEQEIIDRINNDEALASLIGNVGSGNAPLFDTNLAVSLAIISPLVKAIRTAGYLYAGDGGDALYIWAVSEPSHAGKLQSSDGAWWELMGNRVNLAMFGVFNSGAADASPGPQAALDYLEFRGGGILDVPAGNFNIKFTHRIASNISIFSASNTIYKRSADIDCMFISKSDGVTGGYDAAKNIAIIGGINWQGWAGVRIHDNRIVGYGAIDGSAQTAIRGDASKPTGHNASDIMISKNTILNFVRDGSGSGGAGRGISIMGWQLASEAPDPTLRNVIIEDNFISGLGGHAIAVEAAFNVKVLNNTIEGVNGHGVYMYGTARYTIYDNTINCRAGKLAINLVSAHGRDSSGGIVSLNHAYPEIYSNAPRSEIVHNICDVLNYGSLSTGVKGPNLVNGAVVP